MFNALFRRAAKDYDFKITPAGKTIRASSSQTLLESALNQGVPFPYNCRAGGCGECKCRLVEGHVKELTDKSYLLSAEEMRDNYILACQSIPTSSVVVEVSLDKDRPEHPIVDVCGTITALIPLTDNILHLKIQLDQPLVFTAGQYAQICLPAGIGGEAGEMRSYSFACAPDRNPQADQLEFFIRRVPGGRFTYWLFDHAKHGMQFTLRGPYGDLYLRPGTQPMLCIAGGSGLAPLLALLEQAHLDKKSTRDVVLYFGARTEKDLYCLDVIYRLQQSWVGRFDFVPVLSAEPAGSAWTGRRGMIPDHLPTLPGPRIPMHQAYLCGPPPMIDACLEILASNGLASSQIHVDKFLDRSHLTPSGIHP